MPDDSITKFKSILAKLPEDKRKALYARISALPNEERNSFIADFVERYDKSRKVINQPKTETKPPVKTVVKKVEEKKNRPQSESGKKHSWSSINTVLIVLCCVILGVVAVKNRADIARLFASIAGNAQVVEETAESDESEIPSQSDASVPNEGAVQTEQTSVTETAAPTPTPVPLEDDHPDLTGLVVVIDPGHQAETDNNTELLAPDSTISKPRSTSGAVGVSTNAKEYEITLQVGLMVKSYLEQCGASVIITRESNDVDISNQERANLAVAANPDIYIRLHADAAPTSDTAGVRVFVPDSGDYAAQDLTLADSLGAAVSQRTGSQYLGAVPTSCYTGLNYANTIKSLQLVMGYISNSEDERRLTDQSGQYEIAVAIADFCSELA